MDKNIAGTLTNKEAVKKIVKNIIREEIQRGNIDKTFFTSRKK